MPNKNVTASILMPSFDTQVHHDLFSNFCLICLFIVRKLK